MLNNLDNKKIKFKNIIFRIIKKVKVFHTLKILKRKIKLIISEYH